MLREYKKPRKPEQPSLLHENIRGPCRSTIERRRCSAHPMAARLRHPRIGRMADAFIEMQTTWAAADLTREDWLRLLLDRRSDRAHPGLGRRLRQARLRQNAVVEHQLPQRRAVSTAPCCP